MDQNIIEEGEVRLGVFSDTSNSMMIDTPICPNCGSRDYIQTINSDNNCKCVSCGTYYRFNFNK